MGSKSDLLLARILKMNVMGIYQAEPNEDGNWNLLGFIFIIQH